MFIRALITRGFLRPAYRMCVNQQQLLQKRYIELTMAQSHQQQIEILKDIVNLNKPNTISQVEAKLLLAKVYQIEGIYNTELISELQSLNIDDVVFDEGENSQQYKDYKYNNLLVQLLPVSQKPEQLQLYLASLKQVYHYQEQHFQDLIKTENLRSRELVKGNYYYRMVYYHEMMTKQYIADDKYTEALAQVEESIKLLEQTLSLGLEIPEFLEELQIKLSQCTQMKAYLHQQLGQNDLAKVCFQKALETIDVDSKDYWMTFENYMRVLNPKEQQAYINSKLKTEINNDRKILYKFMLFKSSPAMEMYNDLLHTVDSLSDIQTKIKIHLALGTFALNQEDNSNIEHHVASAMELLTDEVDPRVYAEQLITLIDLANALIQTNEDIIGYLQGFFDLLDKSEFRFTKQSLLDQSERDLMFKVETYVALNKFMQLLDSDAENPITPVLEYISYYENTEYVDQLLTQIHQCAENVEPLREEFRSIGKKIILNNNNIAEHTKQLFA